MSWSDSRGERPHTVWVGEKRGKVYLAWTEGKKRRLEITETKSVRDDRGRLLARKVKEAQAEADAKIAELKGEKPKRRKAGPLTIREGIDRAFSPTGIYPLDPAEDQYTRQTLDNANAGADLLGVETWAEITPGRIRSVWRQVYDWTGDGANYDKAKKILAALSAIARHLEGEFPDERFPRLPPKWRAELEEHWKKKGTEIKPKRPRHTPEEMAKLYRHRDKADPRLRLALMLGGPLRGGQVTRTRRSDCDLETWTVQIPYVSRRKKAPRVALSLSERAALREALTEGYLSDLEAAYQAGELEDYALFPGEKLRRGKAVVERASKPADRSSLGKWLHTLEKAAGVETVSGRAWYGLRRLFSDLMETATDDDRVKDEAGGWRQGSEMRRTIYQDQEAREIAEQAADARERLRPNTEDSTS